MHNSFSKDDESRRCLSVCLSFKHPKYDGFNVQDPGAPRQAANAYMVFCKEHRSRVKQQHPNLPFGKIGAKLGAMWRIMSEEAKAPFEAKASLDRERFRKEVDEYHRRSSALTRH
mmetsp:Transcript_4514/g.7242  ORF Transcript_4514/g.7242 Transcript_4514/m.7242 type:complete len:115 (+) Transcript_4514:114-458(+)